MQHPPWAPRLTGCSTCRRAAAAADAAAVEVAAVVAAAKVRAVWEGGDEAAEADARVEEVEAVAEGAA